MFDRFLNGEKIAIHCETEEQSEMLMDILNNYDVKWINRSRIITMHYVIYGKNSCYDMHNDPIALSYSPIRYYREENYEVVEFNKILSENY